MYLSLQVLVMERREIPIYSAIRTDQAVVKAAADRQFLVDFDPKSKALEDYEQLTDDLTTRFTRAEAIPIHVKTA